MSKSYFTLPLKAEKFLKNEEVQKCNLKQSIMHNIHLINTTYFGECSFDETFGSSIWDVDFDNLSSVNKLKEVILKSVLESIKSHEKRLVNTSAQIDIKQEELSGLKKNRIVKKKVTIHIKGKVAKTNESFLYNEYFYVGPLSY